MKIQAGYENFCPAFAQVFSVFGIFHVRIKMLGLMVNAEIKAVLELGSFLIISTRPTQTRR